MNEKNINYSDYTVSVRIGNVTKFFDLDFFAVICDKFLFEELCDFIAQSPFGTVVYSGYRKKTSFVLQVNSKAS